eukprot:3120501-Rhodomonas_salina.2
MRFDYRLLGHQAYGVDIHRQAAAAGDLFHDTAEHVLGANPVNEIRVELDSGMVLLVVWCRDVGSTGNDKPFRQDRQRCLAYKGSKEALPRQNALRESCGVEGWHAAFPVGPDRGRVGEVGGLLGRGDARCKAQRGEETTNDTAAPPDGEGMRAECNRHGDLVAQVVEGDSFSHWQEEFSIQGQRAHQVPGEEACRAEVRGFRG